MLVAGSWSVLTIDSFLLENDFLIPLAKRNEIKEANPEAAFGDIARLVSAAWKACSEEDKKVFFTLAEEDKGKSKTIGLLFFVVVCCLLLA